MTEPCPNCGHQPAPRAAGSKDAMQELEKDIADGCAAFGPSIFEAVSIRNVETQTSKRARRNYRNRA